MCWNADISLKTFLFGLASAFILYFTNYENKKIILIVLSFTFIQFIEFLTWTYIDNHKINRYLSMLAFTVIFIQLLLLNYFIPDKNQSTLLFTLLIITFIIFCLTELKNVNFKMDKGENGHLVWHWTKVPIYWLCIAFAFYLIPTLLGKNSIYFIFTFTTLIISLYFWYKYDTWGTMWCYISNVLWILMLGQHIYDKIK